MTQQSTTARFPTVGDGSRLHQGDMFFREEVQLALRNRGMPLEGLSYPITPTGMHYLLVHYDIPYVKASHWKLTIDGLVSNPVTLDLDEIKRSPTITQTVTMECAGNGRALLSPRAISQPWLVEAVGTAEWTGTPLKGLLAKAGLKDDAVEVLFTGLDRGIERDQIQSYQRSLTVDEATRDEVLLVYEMNGEPLQPQHGYPLRLVVPGWYGMTNVKWLDRIEVIGEPFSGYQMTSGYRYSQSIDDPGEAVSLMRVKGLIKPPGIPDFLTRNRLVEAGTMELSGRAWAGRASVTRVEISDDGGETWWDGVLEEKVSTYAWQGWHATWEAQPGRYVLCVRATDDCGNVQPMPQPWNFKGMGNNMAQRVPVLVE